MEQHTLSHLREDGTVWPPVTPDPPMPPGYRDPLAQPVQEPEPTSDDPAGGDGPEAEPT